MRRRRLITAGLAGSAAALAGPALAARPRARARATGVATAAATVAAYASREDVARFASELAERRGWDGHGSSGSSRGPSACPWCSG